MYEVADRGDRGEGAGKMAQKQVTIRIRRGPQVPRSSESQPAPYRSEATSRTSKLIDRIDSLLA